MRLYDSSLYLLTDVTCEVHEKRRLLTKISGQKFSLRNRFTNPFRYDLKKKKIQPNNIDSGVSKLKKKKLSFEFEAKIKNKNQEIKKQHKPIYSNFKVQFGNTLYNKDFCFWLQIEISQYFSKLFRFFYYK